MVCLVTAAYVALAVVCLRDRRGGTPGLSRCSRWWSSPVSVHPLLADAAARSTSPTPPTARPGNLLAGPARDSTARAASAGPKAVHRSPGSRRSTATGERVFCGRPPRWDLALAAAVTAEPERLLPVIGPSGCGKSSLVRAGLVPDDGGRARAGWSLDPFTPRDDPVGELARALAQCPSRRRPLDVAALPRPCSTGRGLAGDRHAICSTPRAVGAAPARGGRPVRGALVPRARVVSSTSCGRPPTARCGWWRRCARRDFDGCLPSGAWRSPTADSVRPLGREALRAVIEEPAQDRRARPSSEELVAAHGRRHRRRRSASAAGLHPGRARPGRGPGRRARRRSATPSSGA